ncbi:MAG: hypothetical protein LC096_00010 [Bacteroidia bacterium]|nr:hypothetical protein [Bacteroidia bacterium]
MCINCDSQEIPKGDPGNDGQDGANGQDGSDGQNGISIAYIVSSLAPGVQCPCGGTRIEIGPDADYNGVPDVISNTIDICNGCNGRDLYNPIGSIIMGNWDITDTNLFDNTGLGVNDFENWAVCNGDNGTVDLRGRFIVCQYPGGDVDGDYIAIGDTGGEKKHTLIKSEIPAHSHGWGTLSTTGGSHNHSVFNNAVYEVSSPVVGDLNGSPKWAKIENTILSGGSHTHNVGSGSTEDGSDDGLSGIEHENRPPYYVLVFIQRIA